MVIIKSVDEEKNDGKDGIGGPMIFDLLFNLF